MKQGRDALTCHLLVAKQAMENATATAAETIRDKDPATYDRVRGLYQQVETLLQDRAKAWWRDKK